MGIRAAIFDMDGTIVDVPYDWPRIKTELGTEGVPILSYLSSLREPEKSQKWKVLKKYEDQATQKAVLKKGMRSFLIFLKRNGVKRALVTNNSRKNVNYLLKRFCLEFDCLISRESGLWKPSAAPFKAVMKELGLHKDECCVVGDSHFDIKAAEEAGIKKIYILNEDKEKFASLSAEVFPDVQSLRRRIAGLLKSKD